MHMRAWAGSVSMWLQFQWLGPPLTATALAHAVAGAASRIMPPAGSPRGL